MEYYNFSYLHFNGIRINIKTFKDSFQYKIYIPGQEHNYSYIKFDSNNKDSFTNKMIEDVLSFIKDNNIKIDSSDPYWKVQIERGIQTVTFPKF